jgi:hypothetical protein
LADKDRIADEVAREWQQVRLRERMDWLYQLRRHRHRGLIAAMPPHTRRHGQAEATLNANSVEAFVPGGLDARRLVELVAKH